MAFLTLPGPLEPGRQGWGPFCVDHGRGVMENAGSFSRCNALRQVHWFPVPNFQSEMGVQTLGEVPHPLFSILVNFPSV